MLAPLVLTLGLVGAMLWSCLKAGTIKVQAQQRTLFTPDGYPLAVYELRRSRLRRMPHHGRAILFYIQGSGYHTVLRSAEALAGAAAMGLTVVVSERRGVRGEGDVDEAVCRQFSSKAQRVEDHAFVLREFLKDFPPATSVILVGGSEGGDVAAVMARQEPRVTHLVLLGTGGGWSQEQEIRHFLTTQGRYLQLESSADLDAELTRIRQSPDSLELWAGHPFRRWSSYLWDPPIGDLSQLTIPIFLAHGGRDESVPVESARAVREAFAREKKTNLTYREYPQADHAFSDPERRVSLLPLLEVDLLRWFEDCGLLTGTERERFERQVKASHARLFAPPPPRPGATAEAGVR